MGMEPDVSVAVLNSVGAKSTSRREADEGPSFRSVEGSGFAC